MPIPNQTPTLGSNYPQTSYLTGLPQQGIARLLTSTAEVIEAIENGELALSEDEAKLKEEEGMRALLKVMFKTRGRCLTVLKIKNGQVLVPAIPLNEALGVQIHPHQRGLGGYPRFSTSGQVGGKVWIDAEDMVAAIEHNGRVKGEGRGDSGKFGEAPPPRVSSAHVPMERDEHSGNFAR